MRAVRLRQFAQNRREYVDGRLQVLFVIAPQINGGAVNRLSHLLGARRLDSSVSRMKMQTLFFKRQSTVLKNPSHLRFKVAHNVLVLDIEDLAWKDVIPVIHHPVVLQIIFGQFEKVIGKRLALGKQLFETAQTAVQRMPSCIDKFRVRQDQMHEANVREIIGVFVGEKTVARSVLTGSLQVRLPQSGKSVCVGSDE